MRQRIGHDKGFAIRFRHPRNCSILPCSSLGFRSVGVPGRAHLVPGDHLVLYTDGVTEAQDLELNEFGDDR